jgi:carboxyl-terminal processing protease
MKKSVLLLCLALAAVCGSAQNLSDVSGQLGIFNRLYKTLDQYYVDTLNAEKNVTTAIRAMLSDLDPYTEFYDAKSAREFNTVTTGKYAGVGAMIHYYKKEDRCIVYQLYEGKPAAVAGLRDGDVILSVNGKDTGVKGSMAMADYVSSVSAALRGDAGTLAKVRVKRPGTADTLEFSVTRANVQLPSVPYSGMLNAETGYVILNSFTAGCAEEVGNAVKKLVGQGAKSLVLDLRNNGGGLANEAVNLVNLFVPKGKLILKMKGKVADMNSSYATQSEPLFPELPLAVLVNGQSASASEITCGSLQDLDRAVVVGERTYGKGLVQQTHNLPEGTMLKLTTSHYYIPSGRCIQALDYTHRTDQGEAYRTPDSLTHVFHTEAGRPVRDGGGITPDVVVKSDTMPTNLEYLCASDEFFDYVTSYCLSHPAIAPASEFSVTDADYAEFVNHVKASNFSPEYASLKAADRLLDMMKAEGMPKDALDKAAALKESMKPDMGEVLRDNKQTMKEHLDIAVCDRYYYTAGTIENQLKHDRQAKEAADLLADPARYKAILSGKAE